MCMMRSVFFCSLLLIIICLSGVSAQSTGDAAPLSAEEMHQIQELIAQGLINENDLSKLATLYDLTPEQIESIEEQLLEDSFKKKSKEVTRYTSPQQFPEVPARLNPDSASTEVPISVYGMSLFKGKLPEFAPNLQIPTPSNYVLGTGDVLFIDIWGNSDKSYTLTIDKQGLILVPKLGPIRVGGSTFKVATQRVRNKLKSIYVDLSESNSGGAGTFMQLSLGQLRTINVHVTGEIRFPGTYSMPALATIIHSLYYGGGPNSEGSLRNIELIREGRLIATLDLYKYISGQLNPSSGHILRDQDIVRVPLYVNRIQLEGAFKRPGYYEVLKGDSFADLLSYAGGFSSDAYRSIIQVVRKQDGQKSTYTHSVDTYDEVVLEDGDLITAQRVVDRYLNRVRIQGAVLRPGSYEWKENMQVSDLISLAGGLRKDAFLSRAFLQHQQSDYTYSNQSFHLGKALRGEVANLLLKNEDIVVISAQSEINEHRWVSILGEVNEPGRYTYKEGMRVEDLILEAKGLRYAASESRIEVAQHIKDKETSEHLAQIHVLDVDKSLTSSEGSPVLLEPFDYVFVRRDPNYHQLAFVSVSGEVRFPGTYALGSNKETLSSIIKRAGGFTDHAYPSGASMSRTIKANTIYEQQMGLKDMRSVILEDTTPSETLTKLSAEEIIPVGIELDQAMARPNSRYDVQLENRDRIFVPHRLQSVFVRNGVLNPTAIVYDSKYSVKDYINLAGGFAEYADKRNLYVRQANGLIQGRRRFFFISSWPQVRPGAEIIVPTRIKPKVKISAPELIAITSGLLTLALLAINVANTSNSN